MYIPFNTENPELLTLWKESAKMVIDRGYVDIDDPVCQLDEEFGEAVCEAIRTKKSRHWKFCIRSMMCSIISFVSLECRGDKTGTRS